MPKIANARRGKPIVQIFREHGEAHFSLGWRRAIIMENCR